MTHTIEPTVSYYTTEGSVRGDCGHAHRTIEAAARCIARDQHGCASQGGYSDRVIVSVWDDGQRSAVDDSDE